MLCRHCGQDNKIGSNTCWQCNASLLPKSKRTDIAPSDSSPAASQAEKIGAWGGLVVAIVVFQLLAPQLFEHDSSGINIAQVVCAGVVGALGMTLGKALGKAFSKK